MASTLELVLLYLVAAVLGVVVCRSLKLPPMLGYLVVGVLIGPNALALAKDTAGVKHLAEFGVVFLMFVIGLEFNLPKLRSMRALVFGLGMSQVVLTMAGTLIGHAALVTGFAWFLNEQWPMSWQGAVVLAGAIAMSSTAIVVKLMAERLELESEHGRRAMAVLLDGGQRVMRWWLTLVARRKSEELFSWGCRPMACTRGSRGGGLGRSQAARCASIGPCAALARLAV